MLLLTIALGIGKPYGRAQRALGSIAVALSIAIAFTLVPRGARGDEAPAIVIYIEGTDSAAVEDTIAKQLPEDVAVADRSQFAKALAKAGWRGQMGNVIAVAGARARLITAIRKATKAVQAKYAIVGRVRKTRALKQEVWLVVVEPDGTKLRLDRAVPLPKDQQERSAALQKVLEPLFDELKPAKPEPPPEPAPAPAPAPVVQTPPPPKPRTIDRAEPTQPAQAAQPNRHDVAEALFTLAAGYALGGRSFGYSNPISVGLRPYRLTGASIVTAEGELYPLARMRVNVASDLGLYGSYAMALGVKSSTSRGETLGTHFDRLAVGVRARIHTGRPPLPLLGVHAGFGWLRFWFDAPASSDTTAGLADTLPTVWYKFADAGVDARVPLGPVAFYAGGAFLYPFDSGALAARFRGARVFGAEGRAGVAVRIVTGLEARLGAEYTGFFYTFASQPADPYAASGARDDVLTVALLLGGVY